MSLRSSTISKKTISFISSLNSPKEYNFIFITGLLINIQGQLWDKLNRKGRFDEKTVQQV